MTRQSEAAVAAVIGWALAWLTGAVRGLAFVEAWGLSLLVPFAAWHERPPADEGKRPARVMAEALAFSLVVSGLAFVSLVILAGFR